MSVMLGPAYGVPWIFLWAVCYVYHLDCKIYLVSLQCLIEVHGFIAKIYLMLLMILHLNQVIVFSTCSVSPSTPTSELRAVEVDLVTPGHQHLVSPVTCNPFLGLPP